MESLFRYVAPPSQCGYLPSQLWSLEYELVQELTPAEYQEHMEAGDMEAAEKVLNSVKFPNLLYKPIRSVYYTLKGNIAMMKQDFAGAEV